MDNSTQFIDLMIGTIRQYGLDDEKVLDAIRKVPRHEFVHDTHPEDAYADNPLPIGYDQTISQPYTVAFMLHLLSLKKGDNVLEIGTGSGWNTSLLKVLVGETGKVTSIEYLSELLQQAKISLQRMGFEAEILLGDGRAGYQDNAPYDKIIVTCGTLMIMPAWIDQLKEQGILVAPVGEFTQEMTKVTKENGRLVIEKHGAFQFVPMQGRDSAA